MNRITYRIGIACVVAVALALCAGSAMAQGNGNGNGNGNGGGGSSAEYTFVTLDDRPGLPSGWVGDVVKIGGDWYCVGRKGEEDGDRAVMWQVSPDGSDYAVTTHYLADGDFASGINDLGESVGRTEYNGSGLYWSSHNATPLVLPPLTGDNQTYASGINVDGVIVGSSTYRYFDGTDWVEIETAVAWRAFMGEIRGPFPLDQPGTYSEATAVNDCINGVAQAVGGTEFGQDDWGPVGWELECLASGDIAVLSGPDSLGPGLTHVYGINNYGDTCGRAFGLDHRQRYSQAFRRHSDGTIEPLSTTRRASSKALDINDVGQVVGEVYSWEGQGAGAPQGQYGALWEADGKRVDLYKYLPSDTPWRRIWRGTAIDSEGTIAATGALHDDGGRSRALLMIKN